MSEKQHTPEPATDEPPDDEIITCWCGEKGLASQMFDDEVLLEGCAGTGVLECECGGDHLCVCHNHGEVECTGCEDCTFGDDDLGNDDFPEDNYDED